MTNIAAPNLTLRPPRSPRVRLGGYVLLPRMLDKCRADLAGTIGEYKYGCPLDARVLEYMGIDAEALRAQVATGAGDGEVLAWIERHQRTPRTGWEIAHWSDYQDRRGPDGDAETLGFFLRYVSELSTVREDLRTWADVLDLDDHVTFGGRA